MTRRVGGIYYGTPKDYRTRLIVPAVKLCREPLLRRWMRVRYASQTLRVQWRLPWD